MAAPDTSRTRALSITDTLRDRIVEGLIAPGSHLTEVALAVELGASRTPVRDALSRLADEGLLVYQPNRGFLVRCFDLKDVMDAFTLRSTLEGLGCRLVGERGLQPEARERLQALLEEQFRVLFGEHWDDAHALLWQDLNLEFHYALLELADNRWLVEAVRRARKLPIVFDSRSRPRRHGDIVLLYQRKNSQQAFEEHRGIVDALVQREATRAESLMREHILTNRDVLARALALAETGPPASGDGTPLDTPSPAPA